MTSSFQNIFVVVISDPVIVTCGFSAGDMCAFENSQEDDFDWSLMQASTASNTPATDAGDAAQGLTRIHLLEIQDFNESRPHLFCVQVTS